MSKIAKNFSAAFEKSPIARATMASESTASPSPFRLQTPSPFSVTSSLRSSSRHFIPVASLSLRALAFIFSFVSSLSLARPSHTRTSNSQLNTSFIEYPELKYSFIVTIVAFGYSVLQLIKGISDIAHRGFFVTEKVCDYATLILDQLVSYLLISSCSISIPVIAHLRQNSSLRVGAWTSCSMSLATFFVMASSAVLSGYRLCKRVIW